MYNFFSCIISNILILVNSWIKDLWSIVIGPTALTGYIIFIWSITVISCMTVIICITVINYETVI